VSIVSDKPQTTRNQIRGVLTRPDAQLVFVDTPGIHKPRNVMGTRLNDTALAAIGDVDRCACWSTPRADRDRGPWVPTTCRPA